MSSDYFKAVLFDLDGTLLNTLEDLADSMNITLAALGLPQHPVENYRRFVGDGVENLVLRAAPAARQDAELKARVLDGMREQYRKRWALKSRPYQGIAELLDALRARGTALAVFSNKPHEFTLLCVEKLLPGWRFDAVYGLLDGIPRKPDPAGALRIAAELGIPPAGFLYLGDTDTDMKTAKAAGMYPVGALWGFRTGDELVANGARELVEYPRQVLDLLEGPRSS